MDSDRIEKYFNSFHSGSIESAVKIKLDNGKPNEAYYEAHLNRKMKIQKKNLFSLDDLKNEKRLFEFISEITELQKRIIELFDKVNFCQNNKNNIEKIRGCITVIAAEELNVKKKFTNIEYIALYLKHLQSQNNYKLAIKAQQFIVMTIEGVLLFFESWYESNLLLSPLNKDFKKLLKKINDAVNIEKVKILMNTQNIETIKDESKQGKKNYINKHPEHDPNLWSEDCYKLFKYLYDNYYDMGKRTKRKLINIWFYLSENNPNKYNFKATKDNYKKFIKNYGVSLTNKDKPSNYDKEAITMNEHRINFEDSLK